MTTDIQQFILDNDGTRVEITPEQAQEILDKHKYDDNRKTRNVQVYSRQMAEDEFLDGSLIEFGRVNGQLTLVNGHHRLMAMIDAKKPMKYSIQVHDRDPAYCYQRIDIALRKRTTQQRIKSLIQDIPELKGVNLQILRGALSSLHLLFRQVHGWSILIPGDDPGFLRQYMNQILAADRIFAEDDMYNLRMKLLHRTQPLSVILHSLDREPEKAEELWNMVYLGGRDADEPAKSLIKFLSNHTNPTSRYGVVVLRAWINFMSGRAVSCSSNMKVGKRFEWEGLEYRVRRIKAD